MKFERNKIDFELQMKSESINKASRETDEDEIGGEDKESSRASGHSRQRISAKSPKMSCFDEWSDDMDSFFHSQI